MWEMINKLKGKNQNEERKLEVYDVEGKKLEQYGLSEKMVEFWKNIFNKQPNEIMREWNADEKEKYTYEINTKNRENKIIYRQHEK